MLAIISSYLDRLLYIGHIRLRQLKCALLLPVTFSSADYYHFPPDRSSLYRLLRAFRMLHKIFIVLILLAISI